MLDPFVILTADRDESNKIIDFIYIYVNKEAEKANNLRREDTIGKRLLDVFPNFRDSNMFQEYVNVCETGKPVMKEGVYMEFANKYQTIKGIFHTRINKLDEGIIVTYRDITETKNAEEKIDAMMKELARSNRELEQFAQIVSHDLQEPLRTVNQFTKLLLEKNKAQFNTQSQEFASFISDGTNRMALLLRDLLKYARLTSQAKPFEEVDFNKVVADVLQDLSLQIKENKTEINVDPMPTLKADPVQMRQLLQNLIENAIKFKNERKSIIKVSALNRVNEWLFSVSDNGIGIDPQFSDRIFLVFQRLNEREKYEGSGLGLAICKKIIERHNGRIWVESEEGNGSTFYFTIPMYI
ncbi:MAG: GHKL domain-containing protein [Ignavibacteria bacterium]|nr:GHKL domain-containing protein [Ignavibacteria bacterium]